MQDVQMLKSQVQTMLIVLQIVNQLQETILPIFLRRPSTRKILNKMNKRFDEKQNDKKALNDKEPCLHCEVKTVKTLSEDDNQLTHAIFSLKKDPYESTYDDFMELWLQYGHVFLFGTVYPLAAFLALANNLIGKMNIANLRFKSMLVFRESFDPTNSLAQELISTTFLLQNYGWMHINFVILHENRHQEEYEILELGIQLSTSQLCFPL
jgi:hypothetical protein